MAAETTASRNLEFWAGEFGSEYTRRNRPEPALVAGVTRLWAAILARVPVGDIASVLEVGANVGITHRALQRLLPVPTWAIEPNPDARHALVTEGVVPAERVADGDIVSLPFEDRSMDLALTSGVLIHVHPDDLERACRELARVAGRWVAVLEYFAHQPEDVSYRGHEGKLFKRDYGEFFLDANPDFECVDYGFAWRRHTGMDNSTWWLFRRSAG